MKAKRIISCFAVFVTYMSVTSTSLGVNSVPSEPKTKEYKQEFLRINAVEKILKPGPVNNLREYEKLADEIQNKWVGKNKEHYANLMLEICKPLSSGRFDDDRQFDVARRYALLALTEPNQIPLEIELELTGHVMTDTITPRSPKGQEWANRRKQDVEVRFHAWKRLINAIDPNWDPNEEILSPNTIGAFMGLPSGIAPEGVKDPKLRGEYESALQKNQKNIERHAEQRRLRDWLKRFPRRAEEYIVRAYSRPPFDFEELRQYSDKYIEDEKSRSRILDTVKKNMEAQAEKPPKEPAKDPPKNSTPR